VSFFLFFFLLTLPWSAFTFFWCRNILTRGEFTVGARGGRGVLVTPDTDPRYYWGVVIGAAVAGVAVPLLFGAFGAYWGHRIAKARNPPAGGAAGGGGARGERGPGRP
jgi:hypothetical protein